MHLPASGGRMSASVDRNLGESPARLLPQTDDVDMVCVIHFLGGGIEIPFCCSLVGSGLRAKVPLASSNVGGVCGCHSPS